jgi:hypothetical protein
MKDAKKCDGCGGLGWRSFAASSSRNWEQKLHPPIQLILFSNEFPMEAESKMASKVWRGKGMRRGSPLLPRPSFSCWLISFLGRPTDTLMALMGLPGGAMLAAELPVAHWGSFGIDGGRSQMPGGLGEMRLSRKWNREMAF